MNADELWQRLVPMMEKNADYQQALRRVEETEKDYLALLETLSPENREVLQRYITACEAIDDPLLYLAYQLGLADRV